jgi:hypothetical protein
MTNLLLAPPALAAVLSLTGLPGGSNKIQDRSPYGNIGTITGATWKRTVGGLWHLSFDGNDDKVLLDGSISLAEDAHWSICIWVNHDAAGGDEYLLGNIYVAGSFARLRLHPSNTYIYDDANHNANWSGYVLPTAKWILLTIVCNGASSNNLELFENITSKGSITLTDSTIGVKTLGHAGGASPSPFTGYIAIPRILRYSLTQFDIVNIHNREKHLFGVW